jgi:hypothetical protein
MQIYFMLRTIVLYDEPFPFGLHVLEVIAKSIFVQQLLVYIYIAKRHKSPFNKYAEGQTALHLKFVRPCYTYRVYHLKSNPTTITYCGTKIKSEAGPPPCNRLQTTPWHSS